MRVSLGTVEVSEEERAAIGRELNLTKPATRKDIRYWVLVHTRYLDDSEVGRVPVTPRIVAPTAVKREQGFHRRIEEEDDGE